MCADYKYIIIGAGIAGLHLGALLSQHGKVLVLEKSKEIGGRAKTADLNGFKLDFGTHPIRYGPYSAIAKSLEEIGNPIEFIKPGDFWGFLADGTKTIFPAGGIEQIKKSKMVPFKKTLELMILIKQKMNEDDFEALYEMSLENWFEKEKLDPDLRRYLTMACTGILVNPFPDRASAGELLQSIRSILEIGSVFYPRGGWGEIFRRFVNKIKENNGEIRLDNEVNQIIVENSRAMGVKVGHNVIKGETIISTVPVQQLFTILDEKLCKSEFINKCKNLRPTAGVSIDFCLSKCISDINGMIFFEEPLFFGFIPSNLSRELAPSGKSLMTFYRPTNIEDIKDKNKAKKIYEDLKNKIFQFLPEMKENILYERPLFLLMVDGVEVNTEQHRFKRPNNRINGLENLFITGDSVGGEGGGGDVGHTSVRQCYKKILESKNHQSD